MVQKILQDRVLTIQLCVALFTQVFLIQADEISAIVSATDTENQSITLTSIHSSEDESYPDTLDAKVGMGDVRIDYTGYPIKGRLSKSDGKYILEKIWPNHSEEWETLAATNLSLKLDTDDRKRREFRKEGDKGVNFAMFNDQAELIQWQDYKGKWVILNFIFTRCRMQEMCPAQTARMIELQKLAKAKGVENLQQVSVTFDPNYDTPGVLNEYATVRGADLATFDFLTGPKDAMMNVLKQYGVIAFESKNIIDHTVTTLLFDPTGIIVLRRDGTKWSEHEFVDHILSATIQPDSDPLKPVEAQKIEADFKVDTKILVTLIISLVFVLGIVVFIVKRVMTNPRSR